MVELRGQIAETDVKQVLRENARLRQQVERLEQERDWLRVFANHRSTCHSNKGHAFSGRTCDCGFAGALEAIR